MRRVEVPWGLTDTALGFSSDSYDEQKTKVGSGSYGLDVCSGFNNNSVLGENGNEFLLHMFQLTEDLGFCILTQTPTGIL